jgi:hypothetical protein
MSRDIRRKLLLWLQDWLNPREFGELEEVCLDHLDTISIPIDANGID